MSININSNFQLLSKAHIDSRKSFKLLSDMASFIEGAVPEGFITYCEETDKYYKFRSTNEVDTDTGRWREFSSGGGDVIDDTLESSTSKTYSIDKIKELMSKQGGLAPVDVLPNLENEDERAKIELSKIYLVPSGSGEPNEKDEYVCIHTEGTPAVYREVLVTSDVDYDTNIAEINDYVTNGGQITDDYATYITVKTTTAMTEDVYVEMVESINSSDANFDAYTTRVTSEIITPEVTESWKWELIGTRDGGSLEWSEDIIVNNPVGKVVAGTNLNGKTVLDIVAKMLTEVELATVSLSGNPSTASILESCVASITDVVLTATISLGTCTIEDGATITFKKNGVVLGTETYVDGTTTYTYSDTGANITDDTTYSVEVPYDNDGVSEIAKGDIKYEFEYPMFYGGSATKEIADPTALTKILNKNTTQKLSYTVTNGYCVIAIPDTKTITKTVDQNNFDNSSDFTYVTQSVTLGTTPVIYKVYTNSMPVSCTNFTYQFSLS